VVEEDIGTEHRGGPHRRHGFGRPDRADGLRVTTAQATAPRGGV